MSTTSKLSKQPALDWFREAIERIELDAQGILQAFDAAWAVLAAGAVEERWKGWVRQMVQRALTGAQRSPGGLLLKLLRAGPGDDLSKTKKAAVALADWRAAEWDREKGRRAKLAEEYDGEHRLSVCALMYAHRAGLDVPELVRTWERAGRPTQEALEFPGWDRCLEKASREVAS